MKLNSVLGLCMCVWVLLFLHFKLMGICLFCYTKLCSTPYMKSSKYLINFVLGV